MRFGDTDALTGLLVDLIADSKPLTESTTITLETWIGASWVTIHPNARRWWSNRGVLLDPVDTLDQYPVAVRIRLQDFALGPFIFV